MGTLTYLFPSLFPRKEPSLTGHSASVGSLPLGPRALTPDLPRSYYLRENEGRDYSHWVFDKGELFIQQFKETFGLGIPSLSSCLPSHPIPQV